MSPAPPDSPLFDLLSSIAYELDVVQVLEGLSLPMRVCDIIVLYGPQTAHPKRQEHWWAELQYLYDLGWPPFHLPWSTTTSSQQRNAKLLLPMRSRNVQIGARYPSSFATEASVRLGLRRRRMMLEWMAESRFDRSFPGIENPSNEGSLETAKKAAEQCAKLSGGIR